ncbi:MAG: hypothetical protein HY023_00515 [Chloroflexi bacterium]|nr:hypothetical protein [Chloroflexota bacterium]
MARWRLITDDSVTASFGLAADECLAARVGLGDGRDVACNVSTLRLYTYRSHCALVGRFQNVENEIHLDYCVAHGIAVNRRPTGGGAILMGADQLGVALTIPGHADDSYNRARELMAQFSAGIVNALQSLGVEASFRRKNDIEVKGRKIVGLGIYRTPGNGLLFHASLLVGLDIPLMLRALKTPFEKISDKEIATVADRVTTVRREIGREIELNEVRQRVAEGYSAAFDVSLAPGTFTDDECRIITALEREKYLTNDWVRQTTAVADATGSAKVKTPGGLIDVRTTLAGGTIKALYVGGDFFAGEGAVANLEAALRWHSAEPNAVAATLAEVYSPDLATIPLDSLTEAVQSSIRRARVAESAARSDPYGCFVNPNSKLQTSNSKSEGNVTVETHFDV